MKNNKAVCYYRVSSQQQAEKQSMNLQQNKLQHFAEENGYQIEVEGEFKDDGISGEAIDSRPGFQKAMARIEKGDVEVLLVYMIDRIGRF